MKLQEFSGISVTQTLPVSLKLFKVQFQASVSSHFVFLHRSSISKSERVSQCFHVCVHAEKNLSSPSQCFLDQTVFEFSQELTSSSWMHGASPVTTGKDHISLSSLWGGCKDSYYFLCPGFTRLDNTIFSFFPFFNHQTNIAIVHKHQQLNICCTIQSSRKFLILWTKIRMESHPMGTMQFHYSLYWCQEETPM